MLFPGVTLDRQLPNRPQEVRYCRRCVVSNQRPRIIFDDRGVCGACNYAYLKHNVIDWAEREQRLRELLDRFRSRDGSFDCIVPASGGKDSDYVAHQLKYVYGMHPLTVTWAPFMYTDIGWRNLVAFKDTGFDNVLCSPDGRIHRKLSRLAFELLGDAWEPFAYGQKALGYHMATKFGIPLVFYGESGELEYGGSHKNLDKPAEPISDWKEFYYKGSGIDELLEYGVESGLFTTEKLAHNPMELYRPPTEAAMERVNPEMHWFSFYKKWVPQENYYYASENCGFQANPDGRSEGTYSKYASLDDKTDGFHFFLAYIKFGIARATSDAAHEIRDGHLTREEGVALVHRYDGEFPKKYYPEFLEYLGITDEEFWAVIDFYRSLTPHLWVKENGDWKLQHRVENLPADEAVR